MTATPTTHQLMTRTTVSLPSGEVAYAEAGQGPAALFVHGVLVNADLWRNAIWDVSDMRRCIAPDLPAHGASPVTPRSDVSLSGLAEMLEELCQALDLEQVDLVGNDTGGAVAQVFAARHPERIRTFTLTNCDVHENFPPESFKAQVELAKQGELGPLVVAMAGDLALARSEAGLAMAYEHPEALPDEVINSYLQPLTANGGKGLEQVLSAMDAAELMAAEPALNQLHAPTQIVWGTADLFFEPVWAERLRAMIPGVERVTEIEGGMLFFPDERSDELVPLLRDFWAEHA
jgi:pimeloyl-ACP methyl ester carboxylesterase